MPGLIDHVAERNRATIINALESVLGHAAHDLFRQVSRVVFGVAFQHRFQNNALRASRNDFRCRYQFHTVSLQLSLVPGTVVAVSGKAVELPDNDDIKDATLTVLDHLLELRAVVRLGRNRAVDVVFDHREVILLCVGRTFTDLTFDGFLALAVSGITCVDNGSHSGHLSSLHQ